MADSIQRQFGARVRSLRKAQGFTQESLAERAGLHWTYIGGIERGVRNPSLKNIEAIAKALGLSRSVLFDFKASR